MEKSKSSHYISLKKVAYSFYLLEKENFQTDDPQIVAEYNNKKKRFLKLISSKDAEIFSNTLKFPFDLELCQSLFNSNLSEQKLLAIADEFEIEMDFLAKKIREYIEYSYLALVQNNIVPEFTRVVNMLSNEWDLLQKGKKETLENNPKK